MSTLNDGKACNHALSIIDTAVLLADAHVAIASEFFSGILEGDWVIILGNKWLTLEAVKSAASFLHGALNESETGSDQALGVIDGAVFLANEHAVIANQFLSVSDVSGLSYLEGSRVLVILRSERDTLKTIKSTHGLFLSALNNSQTFDHALGIVDATVLLADGHVTIASELFRVLIVIA